MTAEASPAPAGHPTGWVHRLDPLLLTCCLVALVVYLLHGFEGPLSRDLAIYSYGGQLFAEGVAPYVGVLNRAGPLAHVIPGIGVAAARAVEVDDVLGMRVLFMLISVACIGLCYRLGRDLFRSRLSGLAAAATLLSFEGFTTYATYGPREKTAMVLFVLAALLSTVHRRWLTAGVFIALATLTWQPAFLAALAAATVAILAGPPVARLRALGRVVLGGLIPSVATVAAYAAIGQLRVFLDAFVLINARYTQQGSMLDDPTYLWRTMVKGYGWTLALVVLGTLLLMGFAALALVRGQTRTDHRQAALAGCGAYAVAGLLWSMRAFDAWPDAMVILPAAAMGLGAVAGTLARRMPRVGLLATIGWVVVATALAVGYSVGTRDTTLTDQRGSVAAVLDVVPPGSRILSVEAPQSLVLAHQRQRSRFQAFGNGLLAYVDDTWPGGSAGLRPLDRGAEADAHRRGSGHAAVAAADHRR